MRENFKFTDSEGLEINVYKWPAKNECRGIVQISHGMTEHALRYDEFGEFMSDNGYTVYAHDHRGHGYTAPSKEDLGYVADEEGFEWHVQDLYELMLKIKEDNKGLPVYLLGHSMGFFVAQRFLELHGSEIEKCILSGSNGKPPFYTALGVKIAKHEIKKHGRRHISTQLDALCFGAYNKKFAPNRTKADWLNTVEEEVDKYLADEYCGFICTSSFYYDFLRGLIKIHEPEEFNKIPKDIPIYIIAGSEDTVGNFGKGIVNLAEELKHSGVKDVEYKLYEGRRHEIFLESNKKEVYQDVLNFVEK